MNEEKNNLTKKALKAGSYYVIVQFFVRSITFLATPVFARLLPIEQYGLVKIFESWTLILLPIIVLGSNRSIEVAKYDYREKFDNYVSSIVLLGTLTTASFGIICTIFRKPLSKLLGFEEWMLYILVAYIFSDFVIACFQTREKQKMQYRASVIVTIIGIPVSTIVCVALLLYGYKNGQTDMMLQYRLLGFYIPFFVLGVAVAILLLIQARPKSLKKDWKYGIKFSLPLVAQMVSIQIMNQIDKIMIQRMVGTSESAIYSMATTISNISWIIEFAIWGAWLPWLYEKMDRKEYDDIKKPSFLVIHILGIMSIGLTALAPEAIMILGGKQYKNAVYMVAPLVLSTFYKFISYFFSAAQNYEKKTKFVALATMIIMFINVGLNYFGIYKWGYIAASYATVISYLLLIVIMAAFEKKTTGKLIIPIKKTIIVSLIYFGICELFIMTYSINMFIRYAIILVVVVGFLFVNRNNIISLLGVLKGKKK